MKKKKLVNYSSKFFDRNESEDRMDKGVIQHANCYSKQKLHKTV